MGLKGEEGMDDCIGTADGTAFCVALALVLSIAPL